MEKNLKTAQAGTLESSDVFVTVVPEDPGSGLNINIESGVLVQFGAAIRKVVEQTLKELAVTDVRINLVDRGALDCTIRARVLTALARAGFEVEEALD